MTVIFACKQVGGAFSWLLAVGGSVPLLSAPSLSRWSVVKERYGGGAVNRITPWCLPQFLPPAPALMFSVINWSPEIRGNKAVSSSPSCFGSCV